LTETLLRIVVDPNVAISALITPDGITGQVVRRGSVATTG
jgi:predicted nucleic acid-binding protein